jgi:molybdenum cofactor cytidylyltransferase
LKFGSLPVERCVGAVNAHAIKSGELVLKKGDLILPEHVALLQAAGLAEIVVARLEADDVNENEAATRLAEALAGLEIKAELPFTGRCNLFARCDGVFRAAAETIDQINAIDESITVATLLPMHPVKRGEMVATVKIIPFAVPGVSLKCAVEIARAAPLAVAAFRPLRVGVISTLLPGFKSATITKTLGILAKRLALAGATIAHEERVAHEIGALAAALQRLRGACDLVIVFGASAIIDRRDIVPAAIEKAGGRIEHFGMPVDPGNLLLLGYLANDVPIIGAPGCARSPVENGFDFVLYRLLAGLPVKGADIQRMGVGGLLKEIGSRPQPRVSADA